MSQTRHFKVEELPDYAPARREYGYTHSLRTWGESYWELHEGATSAHGTFEHCELLGRYFVEIGKGPFYVRHLTDAEMQAELANNDPCMAVAA